jgi:signal transduction histidine kinase
MSGFTTALLEDFGPLLPPEGHDFTRRIAAGAGRMDQLIHDLLAYGRLNSAELPLGETDPVLFIREFMNSPENKEALIKIDEPLPKVLANSVALDQVFKNLLRNAVKFVAPGVRPEVRVFAEERADLVRICIQDNGIGIDPKFHERIFRVFERLSAATPAYPGTGIGLAIVQKGVERMGGKLGVESALGKGSCFWIELKKAQ